MNNFAIFYHTCDKYSDLWEHFCYFFKKYWPEYDGTIYINSEEKDFDYPGLNIVNLKVGLCDFSEREIRGLARVKEENILLMMDDLFLMGKVDVDVVNEYYKYFVESDIDTLVFRKFPSFEKTIPVNVRQAEVVIPPSNDMLSSQLAFWKKDVFSSLLNKADGPWEMEWFGSMRANLSHLKMVCTPENCIPSLPEGGLHIGKWVPKMVEFLKDEKYDKIDLNIRGYYSPIRKVAFKKKVHNKMRNFFSPSSLQIYKMLWSFRKYFFFR